MLRCQVEIFVINAALFVPETGVERTKETGECDYDDMLYMPLMLREDEVFGGFDRILVDEAGQQPRSN